MSELSEKILKSKSENSNPQMVRLKMLKKKKLNAVKVPRSHKRRTPIRQKLVPVLPEKSGVQNKPIISNFTPSELSLSGEEIREPKKPVVVENEPDQTEVTPPELSATGDEKALIWNDYREDELKARLDKLQKLLDKIKEERLHQLRTKMLKWQEKYIRRLLELEIAMKDFERKSREDKAQIGEQISRIEEMSDINNAIRQRIEKRIAHLLPKMDPQENNFCFTAIIVNFVRVILLLCSKYT